MYHLVEDGVVLECELCLERLPAGSVPMPRVVGGKARPTSLKEVKFLCPCCLRSRRPRYGGLLYNFEAERPTPFRLCHIYEVR
jgi:histone demethylase JARID1